MITANKFRRGVPLNKNTFLNSRSEECLNIKERKDRKENDEREHREEAKAKRYIFKTKLQTQSWWRRSW